VLDAIDVGEIDSKPDDAHPVSLPCQGLPDGGSLHCDGLGQVPRLVHVKAVLGGNPVCE
jgi:hypothetical protein